MIPIFEIKYPYRCEGSLVYIELGILTARTVLLSPCFIVLSRHRSRNLRLPSQDQEEVGSYIIDLVYSHPLELTSYAVYHWAAVTAGPKYGRISAWFAGWLNGLAWAFAIASNCVMLCNMILYAYSLYHPDYVSQSWQVYICYLIISWSCCFIVMFAQRALAFISRLGSFFIIAGFFIAVIVCAVMPSQTGSGYASDATIWKEWNNITGYSSNGFVFIAGMLNGAFAIGAIDCVTHIAEEIPQYVNVKSIYHLFSYT